ncbi:aldehyde dehydrogenase family protein [Frankia tisae]|uniref:aldehyde dehydrogenase family protein n=1 Tax=Frankia tisae TaxID=2950104 RepID=UPI0021C1283A|nr:aldehyde dehydrogenase family protein [Frankia tisae]
MTTASETVAVQGELRLLIDGKLGESAAGGRYDNINPATEEILGQTTDATVADMDRAIAAARRAFDESSWSTDRELRKRCLAQLQAALEDEKEALRAELVAEAGSPIAVTHFAQLDWPLADGLRGPLELIDEFPWDRPLPDTNLFGPSRRAVWKEPVGVVAAIVPWNYPFEVTINKLGPILATGNTVVLKPAPDTPWNATRIGRIIAERTDIPAGVVNVVPTSDNAVAELLVTDPRVDMVSFTGSTGVGRRIVELSAGTMKRTLLELGGKSAMIVLDDADLASVLPGAGLGACLHAGQGCAMTTRILLPRSVYDQGLAILTEVFRQLPYGDPNDPANLSGPQINARQRDRVLDYIEIGKAEGARVVAGGGRPAHLPTGYYVEPTLLADVDNGMRVAREEIFGPVAAVIPFDDEADAVRIANDSPYGLSGGVFSASLDRGLAVARRIRTGSINVNGGNFYGSNGPYGGYKLSGNGRQGGIEGFEQHLESKSVGYAG